MAAVDNMNHNLLSDLYPQFLKQGYMLRLYNAFSEDAYSYMERGIYDLAFITLQDYTQPLPDRTQVRPAYSEGFVIASAQELPNQDGRVSLNCLREESEVFVAWNKEFKAWHMEHATLAQYFLKEDDHWAFATYTAGEQLRAAGAYIYEPQETPPPQITYYLANGTKKLPAIQRFLSLLDEKLGTLPGEKVQSFLS